jgi:SPP1 gp7 family putative phage head morphogenesis protein
VSRPDRYWPTALEVQLRAHLRRRQKIVRAITMEILASAPRRQDAEGGFTVTLASLLDRLRALLGLALPMPPSSLGNLGRAVATRVLGQVLKALGLAETTLPMGATVTEQSRWAVELSQRVAAMEAEVATKAVTAAVLAADKGEDATAAAEAALDAGEARAVFTARDGLGDLIAVVTSAAAQGAGARRFRWVSRRDDRVRDLHVELDGKVFEYPQGHPTEGLPGAPFGCRCHAAAIRD